MSELRIFAEDNPAKVEAKYTQFEPIRDQLAKIGVLFERWKATKELDEHASQDEVIEAYRGPIDRLMQRFGFKSVDVISIAPDNPQREAMRDKFLHEHTHDDFEVRFFVEGEGIFYLRKGGKVLAMLCTRGDLISVPPNTTHWFDMGPMPHLKVIRLFAIPEGWVAKFTGDDIADRFPKFDQLMKAA